MKYILASIAALAISCTANPPILPEPTSATAGVGGIGGNGGAGGMDASSSSASSNSSDSASGSSGSPLPGDGSGTRLKRYVYKSDDGAAVDQTRFYDTMLQIDCQPMPVPIGLRCASYNQIISGMHYDASCLLPAIGVATGCAPGAYATKVETSVACPPTALFRIFTIEAKQPNGFYKSGNTCTPWTPEQAASSDIYAVGPEVDYSQFAAMTLEHE